MKYSTDFFTLFHWGYIIIYVDLCDLLIYRGIKHHRDHNQKLKWFQNGAWISYSLIKAPVAITIDDISVTIIF